tara:strand:+ start:132 stop:380 length:249 start_codon:yes stop_codon:yes gene_type:complete
MIKCIETCRKLKTPCPVEDCRHWINYEAELNCTFESVRKNGEMTLREAADRLGLSFVRVKQLQDKAVEKIKTTLNKNGHLYK